jgi:hypothetical protein
VSASKKCGVGSPQNPTNADEMKSYTMYKSRYEEQRQINVGFNVFLSITAACEPT